MTRAATAIIAGSGALPRHLAEALRSAGEAPLVAALEGFPPEGLAPDITFRVERLVPFLRALEEARVARLVFAGAVSRPRLDPSLFDPLTAQMVPRLIGAMQAGDDATLRAVIGIFEEEGFSVAGVAEIAPDLVPDAGILWGTPSEGDRRDAARAAAIVEAVGRVDVGQGRGGGAGPLPRGRGAARHGCDARLGGRDRAAARSCGRAGRALQGAEAGAGSAHRPADAGARHRGACGRGRPLRALSGRRGRDPPRPGRGGARGRGGGPLPLGEGAMKLFLIAGEPSGDRLGGALMAGLSELAPGMEFAGVGGPAMQARGLSSLFPMEELSVMGLAEILPKYLHLRRRVREAAEACLGSGAEALVTIDSPDFGLRVAALVKQAKPSVRTIHYVAPSVWAWRPGRAAKMARHVDHVLALLPFEPPLHDGGGHELRFRGPSGRGRAAGERGRGAGAARAAGNGPRDPRAAGLAKVRGHAARPGLRRGAGPAAPPPSGAHRPRADRAACGGPRARAGGGVARASSGDRGRPSASARPSLPPMWRWRPRAPSRSSLQRTARPW